MHGATESECGAAGTFWWRQLLPAELLVLGMSLQGQAPATSDLDWERVRALALVHGVAPLLHRAWRSVPGSAPPALIREFADIRRQNALTGVLAVRQRDEILRLLDERDIPYLVLKGAALAQRWYGDMSLRPFVDIDVLLPGHEIGKARQALHAAGYEDSHYPASPHHETPLERRGKACALELHHALTPLVHPYAMPFADLYRRSITLENEGTHVRTLSAEDTLLHLCLHVIMHVKMTHGWRLSHLCDIARHVEVFAVDWRVFRERTQALGLRRGCGAVLGLAAVLTGARVPREEIDEDAMLILVRYPVPGPLDVHHHFLAAFLGAIGHGNLREAATLLLRSAVDWNHGGQLRVRDFQPTVLLKTACRLGRESLVHPHYLRSQLRIWVPEAENLGERERAVAELLAS